MILDSWGEEGPPLSLKGNEAIAPSEIKVISWQASWAASPLTSVNWIMATVSHQLSISSLLAASILTVKRLGSVSELPSSLMMLLPGRVFTLYFCTNLVGCGQ